VEWKVRTNSRTRRLGYTDPFGCRTRSTVDMLTDHHDIPISYVTISEVVIANTNSNSGKVKMTKGLVQMKDLGDDISQLSWSISMYCTKRLDIMTNPTCPELKKGRAYRDGWLDELIIMIGAQRVETIMIH
jgi:hypothetical protein